MGKWRWCEVHYPLANLDAYSITKPLEVSSI